LSHNVQWYKTNNVENVIQEVENPANASHYAFLQGYFPYSFHKRDKEDVTVYIERYGSIDGKGCLTKCTPADWVRFHIYKQEVARKVLIEDSKRIGRHFDSIIVIEDLGNMGWQHLHKAGLELFHSESDIDKDHYPETLRKVFICNTPAAFNAIWKIVKPWLDPNTLAKIEILGYDYRDRLLEFISKENLPEEFGGICRCPGGCCKLGGSVNSLSNDETLARTVVVSSSHEIPIEAPAGAFLCYSFSTTEHDIGFGIVFGPNRELVEPVTRYDCHIEPHQGRFLVKKPGKYTLLFDNSFSLLRKKTLKYQVFIQQPGVDIATTD